MKWSRFLLQLPILLLYIGQASADSQAPWGGATEIQQSYTGQKVVFDATSGSAAALAHLLDRASLLSKLNDADPMESRIVIVLHGDAIPFFSTGNYSRYKDLMQRAQSLSVGDVIEFRMCKAAAALRGLQPKDIHGFVKMVPMAEAEIARLQQEEGFAYVK